MLKIRPPGSLSLLMLVGCLLAGGFTRAERALEAEILPRLGAAKRHGVTWHYTRPPIVSIEYEMDVRGGTRDI